MVCYKDSLSSFRAEIQTIVRPGDEGSLEKSPCFLTKLADILLDEFRKKKETNGFATEMFNFLTDTLFVIKIFMP